MRTGPRGALDSLHGVFVLGAGFSKAISDEMPLTAELREAIARTTHLRVPQDLEGWLSFLAEPQPYLRLEANLENRAQFLRVARKLAAVIRDQQRRVHRAPPPEWLVRLVTLWYSYGSKVLSLNYDTLVESVARELGFRPDSLGPRGSVPLLKLHGSVDESWDPEIRADVFGPEGEGPGWNIPNRPQTTIRWHDYERFDPFIVPPVTTKSSFYDIPVLRDRWLRSASVIGDASTVTLLGYSMPIADYSTARLLTDPRSEAASGDDRQRGYVIADINNTLVSERLISLGVEGTPWSIGGPTPIQQYVDDVTAAVTERIVESLQYDLECGAIKPSTPVKVLASFGTRRRGLGLPDPALFLGDTFPGDLTVERFLQITEQSSPWLMLSDRPAVRIEAEGSAEEVVMGIVLSPSEDDIAHLGPDDD